MTPRRVKQRLDYLVRIACQTADGKELGRELAITGTDRFEDWLSRQWYDVVGSGDLRHYLAGTNVKRITDARQLWGYVSKYLGKVEAYAVEFPGRFWGVLRRENIPTGERHLHECTGKAAQRLMRAMRRYVRSKTGRKRRGHSLSAFCFCDADFWQERLDKLLGEE